MKIFLTFLLMSSFWIQIFSQLTDPFIANFPPTDYLSDAYLSSPKNYCVKQGPLGTIFISNENVLLHFNGKRWRRVEGTENELFFKLALLNHNKIYTAGSKEMGFVSSDSLGRISFRSLFHKPGLIKPKFKKVFNVLVSEDGVVLFLDRKKAFLWNGHRLDSISSKTGFLKAFSVEGKVFIQSENDGLYKMEGMGFEKHSDIKGLDTINLRGGIMNRNLNEEELILFTNTQGVFSLRGGKLNQLENGLEKTIIWNSGEASADIAIVASESSGLIFFNSSTLEISEISEENGLSTNSLLYCDLDQERGIWVASNNGVSRINYSSPLRKLPRKFQKPIFTFSMIKYKEHLLIGSMAGCYRLSERDGKRSLEKLSGLSSLITSLIPYHDGVLIASASEGVYFYNGSVPEKISSYLPTCLKISQNDPKRLWVGTNYGLYSMKKTPDGWVEEGKREGTNNVIFFIEELSDGTIWTSNTTVSRVTDFDPLLMEGNVTKFDSLSGFNPDHVIFEMTSINDKIYFGTNRGIFVFDEKSQQLIPTNEFGERFADKGHGARHMTQDYLGQIWLYDGEKGGVLVPEENGSWKWNELVLRRIEDPEIWSFYQAPDSLIWIGTNTTLYSYDPRIPKDYHVPFNTLMDQVTVNDTQVVFYGNYADSVGNLTLSQPDSYKLTFPFTHNDIAFSYTATSYEYPEKTVFNYWLEGWDEDWSEWGKESDKAYGNLPEGTYTFHARAKNLYDTIGTEAAYTFTILPPWQRTWWAFLLYGAGGLGLIILIVRWQVARANRKQFREREAERLQQREMLQATVSAQEKERSRIAQDLHDDVQANLLAVKMRMSLLGRKLQKEGIQNDETGEMAQMVQGTIDGVREIAQNLMPVSLRRLGLPLALSELCEQLNAGAGPKFIYQETLPSSGSSLPEAVELALFRVAQELLANGVKHSSATEIRLSFTESTKMVRLDYQDDGKGFDTAKVNVHSGGLGLKNIESRISLIGGTFDFNSQLGEGSQFWLEVPLKSFNLNGP